MMEEAQATKLGKCSGNIVHSSGREGAPILKLQHIISNGKTMTNKQQPIITYLTIEFL